MNATKPRSHAKRTLAAIAKRLEQIYGDRHELRDDCEDILSELVLTILSQNTTARNTERAYTAMRQAFPTWEVVMNAPQAELEHALRPAGLARTRSARIQSMLRSILDKHGRLTLDHLQKLDNESAAEELAQYPGVGPKTVHCVLLFAMQRDVFPVDTHIHRILIRMGLLPADITPEAAHEYLRPLIPAGTHLPLHVNLIAHGRDTCRPRNPACDRCTLYRHCRHYNALQHNPAKIEKKRELKRHR